MSLLCSHLFFFSPIAFPCSFIHFCPFWAVLFPLFIYTNIENLWRYKYSQIFCHLSRPILHCSLHHHRRNCRHLIEQNRHMHPDSCAKIFCLAHAIKNLLVYLLLLLPVLISFPFFTTFPLFLSFSLNNVFCFFLNS